MLVAFTTLADPALALLISRPDVAIVVPRHLSQPGWCLDNGEVCGARLVISRGALRGDQVTGVITRLARVTAADLTHFDPADRDYATAEMTAFLAALLDSLPCPVINRPTAANLLGPPWTQQHWLRAASAAGIAVCAGDEAGCGEGSGVALLDRAPLDGNGATDITETARRVAALAEVHLVEVVPCRRDGGVMRVSLQPMLTAARLEVIADALAAGQVAS